MATINIFNKRTYAKRDHPHSKTFYCGRRMRDIPGSPLANPFKIQKGRMARAEAIYQYQCYFRDRVSGVKIEPSLFIQLGITRDEFMQALADICLTYQSGQDVDLLCWCSPDAKGNTVPCHCGIIKEYVIKVSSL